MHLNAISNYFQRWYQQAFPVTVASLNVCCLLLVLDPLVSTQPSLEPGRGGRLLSPQAPTLPTPESHPPVLVVDEDPVCLLMSLLVFDWLLAESSESDR